MDKIEKKVLNEIETLIVQSKNQAALSVNTIMSNLYWQIGKKIKLIVLKNKKPDYGKNFIESLGKTLSAKYGKGYRKTNLFNAIKVFEVFEDESIFHALSGKLSWTHFRTLVYVQDPLKRDFYIEMCKLERWTTRILQERIKSMLYERTALSKKPDETIKKELQILKNEQKINADLVFKDPYFLDFLGLKDTYSEKDMENAILAELQSF